MITRRIWRERKRVSKRERERERERVERTEDGYIRFGGYLTRRASMGNEGEQQWDSILFIFPLFIVLSPPKGNSRAIQACMRQQR